MAPSLLVEIAIKVSCVLASAWVVTRAMRRRSAAARHLVWTIAVLAMLLVPAVVVVGPEWPVPMLPGARSADGIDRQAGGLLGESAESLAESLVLRPERRAPADRGLSIEETGPVIPSSALPRTTEAPWVPLNWGLLAIGLWLAGAMLFSLRLLFGMAWVARTARRARPVDDPAWISALDEARRTLRITAPSTLYLSDGTSIPVVSGLWRHTLLLPLEAGRWTEERRRVVLLHELSHVRRRDTLVALVAQVARALHWFNPLAHMAVGRLRMEQERACDDLVLEAGTRAPDYADHLVQIAQAYRARGLAAWSAPAMARPSELEGRLLAILDGDRSRTVPSVRVRLALGTLLMVILVPLGTLRAVGDAGGGASERIASQQQVARAAGVMPIVRASQSVQAPSTPPPAQQPGDAAGQQTDPIEGRVGPSNESSGFNFMPDIDLAAPDGWFNEFVDIAPGFPGEVAVFPPHGMTEPLALFGQAAPVLPGQQTPADPAEEEARRRAADALGTALKDNDERVRQAALQALSALRDARAIPALVQALQSPDITVRRTAVNALARFDSDEAVRGLMTALEDEDPEIRMQAASALGLRASPLAIDALTNSLKDQDPRVRERAARALGNIASGRRGWSAGVAIGPIGKDVLTLYGDAAREATKQAQASIQAAREQMNALAKSGKLKEFPKLEQQLKRQLDLLQRQLDQLERKGSVATPPPAPSPSPPPAPSPVPSPAPLPAPALPRPPTP
jgi:beta-lactamase regulating signal transducer with metallopeptidase domain